MKLSDFGHRVAASHGYSRSGRASFLPHLRWELEQVMSRVRPEDLSAVEIAAILTILTPAHCRVIGGPAARPGRSARLRSEQPSPEFAQ